MKLNNHGWGMREMIIYTCIMILLLLFVASSISSFYSSMEASQAEKEKRYKESLKNQENKKKEEQEEKNPIIEVDYDYYENLENKIKTATYDYMNDNAYNLDNQILNVTLDTLVNLNYLEKFYDQTGANACTGYSNVYEDESGAYVINSYISCSNYTTDGY